METSAVNGTVNGIHNDGVEKDSLKIKTVRTKGRRYDQFLRTVVTHSVVRYCTVQ